MGAGSQPAPGHQLRFVRRGRHLCQQRLGGGTFFNGTALQGFILHWNGQKWARQASPNPGGAARDTRLNAIAACAASGKAWAVGSYFDGTTDRTLILAWTGSKWVQQASPTPGDSFLQGAATTGASNTWTVGAYEADNMRFTLILHWNGRNGLRWPAPPQALSACCLPWPRPPPPTPGPSASSTTTTAASTRTSPSTAVTEGPAIGGRTDEGAR